MENNRNAIKPDFNRIFLYLTFGCCTTLPFKLALCKNVLENLYETGFRKCQKIGLQQRTIFNCIISHIILSS